MAICIECKHCDAKPDQLGRLRYTCNVRQPPQSCGVERRSGECGRDGKLFERSSHVSKTV